MQRLRSNSALLLIAAGFGLFAVLLLLRAQGEGGASEPPAWTSIEEAVAPTAQNVDPGFHARLMALRTHLDAAPEDTTLLLEAARLEQDAHQLDEAAAHYERYLTLVPRTRQVWLDLANVYAGLGQWDEARRVSEVLLDRFPDDPSAMYNLGAIAANGGDRDEARRRWASVRAGSDAALAAQATASLAQLDGRPIRAAPSAPRATPNPHAGLGQPVVARRLGSLGGQE